MKIVTLGTSHGVSEKGRYCSSGILETGGVRYIIDLGAPTDYLFTTNGLKYDSIRGIFITHMHTDHAGTLPFLVGNLSGKSAIRYIQKRENAPEIMPPVTVTIPESAGRDALLVWMKALHSEVDFDDPEHPFWSKTVTLQSLEECDHYEDENIRVRAIRTEHEPAGSYAYDICAEGKRVLFTGDLHHTFRDFPKVALSEHFDAIVCEYTHYQPEAALPTLQACKTDRLIFNHIFDPDGSRIKWFEENREKFPFPVTLANDGDEFEI